MQCRMVPVEIKPIGAVPMDIVNSKTGSTGQTERAPGRLRGRILKGNQKDHLNGVNYS